MSLFSSVIAISSESALLRSPRNLLLSLRNIWNPCTPSSASLIRWTIMNGSIRFLRSYLRFPIKKGVENRRFSWSNFLAPEGATAPEVNSARRYMASALSQQGGVYCPFAFTRRLGRFLSALVVAGPAFMPASVTAFSKCAPSRRFRRSEISDGWGAHDFSAEDLFASAKKFGYIVDFDDFKGVLSKGDTPPSLVFISPFDIKTI